MMIVAARFARLLVFVWMGGIQRHGRLEISLRTSSSVGDMKTTVTLTT